MMECKQGQIRSPKGRCVDIDGPTGRRMRGLKPLPRSGRTALPKAPKRPPPSKWFSGRPDDNTLQSLGMRPLTMATLRKLKGGATARVVTYDMGRPYLYSAYLDDKRKPVLAHDVQNRSGKYYTSVVRATTRRDGAVTMGPKFPMYVMGYV